MAAITMGSLISSQDSSEESSFEKSHHTGLHKQLRKTKFCMYHLQGNCRFGTDCAFAHTVSELQNTPDLRKTQLCKAFENGECYDPNCGFAHDGGELRSTGTFYKTSLCIWHSKGRCRNGNRCRFAHGVSELRSEPPSEDPICEAITATPVEILAKQIGFNGGTPPSVKQINFDVGLPRSRHTGPAAKQTGLDGGTTAKQILLNGGPKLPFDTEAAKPWNDNKQMTTNEPVKVSVLASLAPQPPTYMTPEKCLPPYMTSEKCWAPSLGDALVKSLQSELLFAQQQATMKMAGIQEAIGDDGRNLSLQMDLNELRASVAASSYLAMHVVRLQNQIDVQNAHGRFNQKI